MVYPRRTRATFCSFVQQAVHITCFYRDLQLVKMMNLVTQVRTVSDTSYSIQSISLDADYL